MKKRKVIVHGDDGKIYEVKQKRNKKIKLKKLSQGDRKHDLAKHMLEGGITEASVHDTEGICDGNGIEFFHLMSLSSLRNGHDDDD